MPNNQFTGVIPELALLFVYSALKWIFMARRRRNLFSLIAFVLISFLGITLFGSTINQRLSSIVVSRRRPGRSWTQLSQRLSRRLQSTPLNRSTFFEELYEYADAFPNSPREGNLYRSITGTIQSPWRQNNYNTRYFKLVFEEGTNMSTYDHMMLTQENTPIGSKITTVINPDNYTLTTKEIYDNLPKKSLLPQPPYKTCSVVGSSGILLGSHCGRKIDEADVVFRFNLAPTDGFENDVGTKTNMTSMNPSIHVLRIGNLQTSEDIKKFYEVLYKTEGIVWTSSFASGVKNYTNESLRAIELGKKSHHKNIQFVFEDTSHFRAFREFWKDYGIKKWSSTGFYFINSALAMCEHVQVFGFWPFTRYVDGRTLKYHYHDDIKLKRGHDMPFEFKLIVAMHHYGLLKLHAGKCEYNDNLNKTTAAR